MNRTGGKGEGGEGEASKGERNWAAIAAALPGCVLGVASVIALMMAAFGDHPMWAHEEINLAEAAGVREEAEVVRLIEQGQDPNARYQVRPGLVFERAARLTPLEAAVLNNDPVMAAQLIVRGATLDAPGWVALRCVAADSRVAPVLDAHRPPEASLQCAGARTPWD